jgi:predicted nucleic acid-binding protein
VIEAVFLDAGPLGLVTKRPNQSDEVNRCQAWLRSFADSDLRVIVPEIADYEVRRELLRAGNTHAIERLDELIDQAEYVPLDTLSMRRAAALWAEARNQGIATADKHALDGDIILCAQVLHYPLPLSQIVVATSNVRHLERFVNAALWQNIMP